jgi:hypothetical protein
MNYGALSVARAQLIYNGVFFWILSFRLEVCSV